MSNNILPRKRGKPREFDENITYDVLESYKESIITEDGKVLAKSSPKWNEIITKLNKKYKQNNIIAMRTAESLYSYVSCNKDNVRSKLCTARGIQVPNKSNDGESDESADDKLNNDSDSLQESSVLEESLEFTSDDVFQCDIYLPYNEFEKLLVVHYEWTQKKRYTRKVLKLKQGQYD